VTRTPTTDEWGIDASWLDALDKEHEVAQETIDRLREVIGRPPADLEAGRSRTSSRTRVHGFR
jgi:4-alpha-glucanotransferase